MSALVGRKQSENQAKYFFRFLDRVQFRIQIDIRVLRAFGLRHFGSSRRRSVLGTRRSSRRLGSCLGLSSSGRFLGRSRSRLGSSLDLSGSR